MYVSSRSSAAAALGREQIVCPTPGHAPNKIGLIHFVRKSGSGKRKPFEQLVQAIGKWFEVLVIVAGRAPGSTICLDDKEMTANQ